jgi:long-chain acyl-CoA synthetase
MLNYTSGTTGSPKGVKVHAFGTVMDVVAMSYSLKAQPDDIFISYLPSPHVFD